MIFYTIKTCQIAGHCVCVLAGCNVDVEWFFCYLTIRIRGNLAFQTQPVPRPRLRLQPDPVSRGEEAGEGEADQEGGGEVKKKGTSHIINLGKSFHNLIFCRKDFFAEKNARAFAEVEERMRRTLEITDVAVEDEADGEDKFFPLFNYFIVFLTLSSPRKIKKIRPNEKKTLVLPQKTETVQRWVANLLCLSFFFLPFSCTVKYLLLAQYSFSRFPIWISTIFLLSPSPSVWRRGLSSRDDHRDGGRDRGRLLRPRREGARREVQHTHREEGRGHTQGTQLAQRRGHQLLHAGDLSKMPLQFLSHKKSQVNFWSFPVPFCIHPTNTTNLRRFFYFWKK